MNIVLVVFDSLRKDCVGVYGSPPWGKVRTPHFDALAGESLVMTRAFPESLPTLPTRRALYTGQRVYPFDNGDFRLKGDFVGAPGWGPIPEEQATLAEMLTGAGYRTGLIADVWKHAPHDTAHGRLPSRSIEVNGELLQVCSRLYWLTREQQYRRWVFRLADNYFLRESILEAERLQLDDHDCEIIGGLSEAYLIAARTDPERWSQYRAPMHAILDRVLEYGRNRDGLLYHTVNPATGEVLNDDLTDNWGYNYNALLTVAAIDGDERYREAVKLALTNIHKYADYQWERGGADGYADSIEGAINLLNRLPVESGFGWVDESMRTLLAKQADDGIIEGWHGDGGLERCAWMTGRCGST